MNDKHHASKESTWNSGLWKQGLLLTMLFGFTVLIVGGYWVYKEAAPRPLKIVSEQGETLTTYENIMGGQAVYQSHGLMQYGSTLGHGSYLGPDFTAEALHITTETMRDVYAKQEFGQPYNKLTDDQAAMIAGRVRRELKANRFNEKSETLTLTDGQTAALYEVRKHYKKMFSEGSERGALQPNAIIQTREARGEWLMEGDQADHIADFFYWTAWLSTAKRPDKGHSYTNNWPSDEAAGNVQSAGSYVWSGVSATLLVVMVAVILFLWKRFRFESEDAYTRFPKITVDKLLLTPSQRAVGKYFFVVCALFLVQTLLGGYMAHSYVEGASFYGVNLASILPFNIARTWHLQLAIFWIATAWIAMGIFVTPLISGREPKKQKLLVDMLFWALVVLVAGSLTGEYLGVRGTFGENWFLFGHQGWEYVDLGRFWQIILAVGLGLWLFIMYRGLKPALKAETDKGGLTHLLLYASASIPLFYGFAFFMNPGSHITMADFWRWWVIHLWVEGMFEVFAVVVIGFLMVNMGLVTKKSTLRALYFQLVILLGSGIIGTGHHYYWVGMPEMWIALGSVFSALEVIPLTLLVIEAYEQYRYVKEGGRQFPYKWAFMFLVATAFWNLFGAGVLGFLINLPSVNFFSHGSFLTAAHAHGALMGVYGMLGIALMLFSMRSISNKVNEKLLKMSFWGLNAGLMGMILITLLPVGMTQLVQGIEQGFWSVRTIDFYYQPTMHLLLWLRMIPDSIFIALGVIPLTIAVFKMWRNPRSLNEDIGSMTFEDAILQAQTDADVVEETNYDDKPAVV
ncbi:MAG: nitric-oxide reductase large subunit [Ectothiorhodospiraceae bacterium]|nr:nitric-oxide reductase large subunit [Ectothiorhodospiraceae bacterium]